MNQEMPKSSTTAINNLNPKAQIIQGQISRVKLLRDNDSLHLYSLYLLLISLLCTIGFETKNTQPLLLTNFTPSNRLLMIEGAYIPMALKVNSDKNTPSFFAFHQEAKQPILSFDLQKQSERRSGVDPGGSAPEAKVHS